MRFLKIVLLAPLSWIYGGVVALRNALFDWGVLEQRQMGVPIISVGNITVGGTGKTPLTEYLISILLGKGRHVAMVSRGYKRKTKGYRLATTMSTADEIGDEPFQVKRKFADLIVAVDAKRERAITHICDKYGKDKIVVVLDDAFQYRYVEAGVSIVLIDYNRLIYEDHLLPLGRLRESAQERYRADILLVTKCPPTIQPIDMRLVAKHLTLLPTQRLYFTTLNYGMLYNVFDITSTCDVSTLHSASTAILVVTGIASPTSLYAYIEQYVQRYKAINFPDHHAFTKGDWSAIVRQFDALEAERKLIVVTEKDAARMLSDGHLPDKLKPYIYALPLQVGFVNGESEAAFRNQIFSYVEKNKRNGSFS